MKKLSFQKIFCFVSFIFILGCCLFYGGRFLILFLQNRKEEIIEKNSLAKVLKENNAENENFKSVNGQNYFTGNEENNYLMYSNILWRIIKLNDDNSITAISDKALTYLAYGKTEDGKKTQVFNWLNKTEAEHSGILEKNLSPTYLQKTVACNDKIDELSNNPCKENNTDNYFTLLTVADYLNIGSKDSYLVNEEYFYLNNVTTEDKVWYIDDEGNGKLGSGNDIMGIRPVITILANTDYVSGNGTLEEPYMIEKENGLLGSYVKLGEDIWRVYEIDGNNLRLMLNDYIKVNGEDLTYHYSTGSSYHNDTASGSIAYYINNDFLNNLPYKDKIAEAKWSNGYYNSNTNFDYTTSFSEEVDTKVALMSIGNIFVNPDLVNYYTMTGASSKGSMVYVINADRKIFAKQIGATAKIVPTISFDKKLLTKGNGTKTSPLEME